MGQSVSLLGDYLAFFFALPVFIRDTTGSATQLGLLAVFETGALLIFGFFAGVLLDRVRIRRVIVIADLVRAAGFALLAVAVAIGSAESWMGFAVAFLVGSMGSVFDSGLEGLMPAVLTDDLLVVANSRLTIGRNLAQTVGFVAGGIVVAAGGITGAFAFNAFSYLVSAGALLMLIEVRPRALPPPEALFPSLREGIQTLWRSSPLRWATLAATLTNLAFAPLAAVLTLYARDDLGIVGDRRLGVFFAGFSSLGVVGATLAPRLVGRFGLGRAIIAGGFIFGVGAASTGFIDGWWAVGTLGLALSGVAINQVGFVTLRQRITPPDRLGRVIAASRTISWIGIPIGAALGGLLGDRVGLRPIFVGGGLAISLVAALLILGPLWDRHLGTNPVEASPVV